MAYANGRLPSSALVAIPGGRLAIRAGRAWNAGVARCRRRGIAPPMPNGPDSTYRVYARQVWWKRWWTARGKPGNAATPGTSNHGIGEAVDSNDHDRTRPQMEPFGWGPCTDAPWEPWHRKWCGGWDAPADPLKADERRVCNELQALRRKRVKSPAVRRRITHLSEWLYLRARAIARKARHDGWKGGHRAGRYRVIVNVLGDDVVKRLRRRFRRRKA